MVTSLLACPVDFVHLEGAIYLIDYYSLVGLDSFTGTYFYLDFILHLGNYFIAA